MIIAKESAEDFHQKLNNPDPKRVEIRRKTLERACKLYNKYK